MFNFIKKKPKFGSPEYWEQEFGMPEKDYWKSRYEKELEGKDIVTRYLVCFGSGHYKYFCGIQEIKGYHDKTYPEYDDRKPHEENWVKTIDCFYQIYPEGKQEQWIHRPDYVFETARQAQDFYNIEVDKYIKPLQARINALNSATD